MAKSKFKFQAFSRKQKQVLTWWTKDSPHYNKDAIICDGAVRSGKTLIMSLSFIIWAMDTFSGMNFGLTGKTIGSFKRNVWFTLNEVLLGRGYRIKKLGNINDAYIISKGKIENRFYIFGGKDERSSALIQGFTAAGIFFDEVALMPQSFVEQALARCSVDGAKVWFNCNPEGPFHWFKKGWIDNLVGHNALRIHFLLNDNPSLTQHTIERYERSFSGIFYERFILGRWVLAEGVIYSMFRKEFIYDNLPKGVKILQRWISIDYGQSNATVFLLIGQGSDNKFYIEDEYHHSGRDELIQKSPTAYSRDYFKWKIKNGVDGVPVNKEATFIDPSAKGFMLQLHEDGEKQIRAADNDVIRGIELVSSVIDADMLRISRKCKHTIQEFSAYRWDPKAQETGEDKPIKQFDHCMDALRYMMNGKRVLIQHMLRTRDRYTTDIKVLDKNRV